MGFIMGKTHYRKFLQSADSNVDSYVHVEAGPDTHDGSTDISFKLADCNRSISLDFTVRGKERSWGLTKKQALAKLEKLEKALAIIRGRIEAHDG